MTREMNMRAFMGKCSCDSATDRARCAIDNRCFGFE